MSVKDFVQQRRDALIAMRRDFICTELLGLEYRICCESGGYAYFFGL